MPNENPLADIQRELESHRREASSLARKASFGDEVRAVTDRVAKHRELEAEIKRLRGRGWVWDPAWEATIGDLEARADGIVADLRQESARASERIQRRLDGIEAHLNRLSPSLGIKSTLDGLGRELDTVKDDVRTAEERIAELSAPIVRPHDALATALKEADTHLDRFDAAKFRLGAGEQPWLTVDATWEDSPNGKLNGFLYFSDKRIRFEHKETVVTKKFLFFTASSEEKHELLLDEPVGNLAGSVDKTRGLVFKDQLLELKWAKGARYPSTRFDVNTGYAKDWDDRIESLRDGNLDHLRIAGTAGPATTGMPIDAPTKCEACSAALDAPVRGMTTLVCKFCGQRHDLRF
jgi:hypothetical protein